MEAFLGLGSNLGDRLATLQRAIDLLAAEPGIRVIRTSRIWETDPVGGPEQPDFLNTVADIDTTLEPLDLLGPSTASKRRSAAPETSAGAPRTVDIDILLIDDLTIADDRLTVPHPRMHQRAFVVMPLLELIADPVLPNGTRLLDVRLPDQPVRPASHLWRSPHDDHARACDATGKARRRRRTCPDCAAPLYELGKPTVRRGGRCGKGPP